METAMNSTCIYLDISFLRFIRTSRSHNASYYYVPKQTTSVPTTNLTINFQIAKQHFSNNRIIDS